MGGFIFNLETPDTQRVGGGLEEREAAGEYRVQGARMEEDRVAARQTEANQERKKKDGVRERSDRKKKPVCG